MPREPTWRLGKQRKFLLPGEVPKVWAAAIFENGLSGSICQQFLKAIVLEANDHGLMLGQQTYEEQVDRTGEEWRE